MIYILVEWIHKSPNYPVLLYSELDNLRNEVRKIEVYPNGKIGYASLTDSNGLSELGLVPVPELSEIAKDKEFKPREITKEEFESIWLRRDKEILDDGK